MNKMDNTGVKLTGEQRQKALDNGIPVCTAYRRINNGWDVEKAITKTPIVPDRVEKMPRLNGAFYSPRPRTKTVTFYPFDDNQEKLAKVVKDSGLSRSEFLARLLDDYLSTVDGA